MVVEVAMEVAMEVVVAQMMTVVVVVVAVFTNKLQRMHNATLMKEQPVLLQVVLGVNPELSWRGDVRAALEQ